MATITGKTKTGFTFKIDEEARDDMELMEAFIGMSKGDYAVVPDIISGLLGEDQKKKLYEHCRDKKTGRVLSTKVYKEVENIMEIAREKAEQTKNS